MDKDKFKLQDLRPYLEVASANSGFPLNIIEKDFWVCWVLEQLFNLKNIGSHLIFKGGTTLSKVYSVIDRFSEDVDISIDKEILGFCDEKDPEKATSNKKQQQLIENLSAKCKAFVQQDLKTALEDSIAACLENNNDWSLTIDQHDPDGQSILFHYPVVEKSYSSYILPSVKIELGARSDHWPSKICSITPYLNEYLSIESFPPHKVNVKVLDIARTFWEKATILHMYAHWPKDKMISARQSRHYYDFFKLIRSKYLTEAVSQAQLLNRVSKHKQIYFRSGWAKYDEAIIGTLKLNPAFHIEQSLQKDYQSMQEMFFKKPPSWDEIATTIDQFEKKLNSTN